MPPDRGMQPSHWVKYLNQLADRIEKGPGNIVTGDPRALRDTAKAIEELDNQSDPETPLLRERVNSLALLLQEGIDGGQRAKAELDERLEHLYRLHDEQVNIRGAAHVDLVKRDHGLRASIEALEDKAGSIGEWQESVDTQLNEIYGRLLELEQRSGPSGWSSEAMTEFVNQIAALETSVLRIETALGNVGIERPKRAQPVRLTYYDARGTNLYSVYVERGSFVTPPPASILDRIARIEVS